MKIHEVNERTKYSEFVKLWIEYHKNFIKESTYANYKQIVYRKLIPYFSEIRISQLNKRLIQSYVVSQEVATKSIKDDIVVVKQTINYLFENEIIEEFSISKLKYKKQHKKKIEFLNKEDYLKLKDWCISNYEEDVKFKYHLGVLIALGTGMRIGEICGLKFKDIDFVRNVIQVKRTLQRIYIPGEGTKVIIDTPKTSASVREIPMTNDIKKILKKLDYVDENFVLKNERPIEPRLLRKGLNTILEKNKMPHFKFHSLRHTFATLCITNGIDIKTVSELLGHANAKMTLDIYTHTTIEQKHKAIEILQSL